VTDPVLLERALANLVDNSLLHAGGAGLRIEAGAVAVAGRVDIRIIDRGPGIRPADRERIFQPFQRLGDSENRSGVGLGLAVARGFVEAVGGELEVEDTPGGGCTMVVRIPVDQTPDPLASPGDDRGPDPEEAPPRTAEASAP
jgi:two-component system sensor histidine kinase KdpD